MKTILVFAIILFTCCPFLFADEIQLPFSCYPKKLQAQFAEKGYKLDLSANDRDEKSWGFLENKGTKFSIFTYTSVTKKDLKDIQQIVGE